MHQRPAAIIELGALFIQSFSCPYIINRARAINGFMVAFMKFASEKIRNGDPNPTILSLSSEKCKEVRGWCRVTARLKPHFFYLCCDKRYNR